jgi:hypothetical protein
MRFHGAMQPVQPTRTDAGAWFVEADRAPPAMRGRSRSYADSSTSARAIIATSLFLVLFASALLIGGHAALDPLLQSAIQARQPKGAGDVVVALPDGIHCRHLSFDNTTAEVTEGALEHCPDGVTWERGGRSPRTFAWGH